MLIELTDVLLTSWPGDASIDGNARGTPCRIDQMEGVAVVLDIEKARQFHGHICPGLATGVRVAQIALQEIGHDSDGEGVIAIVEADNCAVDAIQYFTGCTFGKGNLIHRDFGKNAFTFIRRSDGKAVRIVVRPDAWGDPEPEHESLLQRIRDGAASDEDRQAAAVGRQHHLEEILRRPAVELFDVQAVDCLVPESARIYESIRCAGCCEAVMETRIRLLGGKPYCIPCFDERERRV